MDDEQVNENDSCYRRHSCRVRYVLSFLCFWSLMNLYALRINLSIAIVAMVKSPRHDAETNPDVCQELAELNNASTKMKHGEYDWSPTMQGYVMSAFFYGYFITPMLAGVLANTYGALWVLGGGVLLGGVFTLLIPVAAKWSPWALFAVRVVIGIGSGVGFPSLHTLIGKWYPKDERSFQTTLIYNGVPTGCILALVCSGLLIKSGFLEGWPSVFYVTGLMTCTWFVFWAVLVYESPHDHPFIGESELKTIMGGLRFKKPKRGPIPWRAIATSVPFYALCWTHFCNNWGFYLQLSYVPTFLNQVLHMDIVEDGLMSSLPYITFLFLSPPAGFLVDKLRNSGVLPITVLRKIANSIASFVPALCLIVVPFLGCRVVPIIVLFALSTGLNGLKLSGFEVTHIDMSPEFAGILMSGTNTVANFGGMIGPLFVGYVQEAYDTEKSWKIIFVTTGLIYISGGIVYIFFGSADLQPWGTTRQEEESQEDTETPGNKQSPEDTETPENKQSPEDTETPGNKQSPEESETSVKSSGDENTSSTSKNSDKSSSSKDVEIFTKR